ncbi:MAG: hypothetical protein WAW03_17330, partial [Anaerolineae bacterium]
CQFVQFVAESVRILLPRILPIFTNRVSAFVSIRAIRGRERQDSLPRISPIFTKTKQQFESIRAIRGGGRGFLRARFHTCVKSEYNEVVSVSQRAMMFAGTTKRASAGRLNA